MESSHTLKFLKGKWSEVDVYQRSFFEQCDWGKSHMGNRIGGPDCKLCDCHRNLEPDKFPSFQAHMDPVGIRTHGTWGEAAPAFHTYCVSQLGIVVKSDGL